MTIPGNSPGGGRHSYYSDTLPNRIKPSEVLKAMFPTSPLYDGSYNQEQVVAKANEVLAAGTVGTGANGEGDVNYMYPEGVRMDYQDSPDIREVAWGAPGGPANPYMPDIRSPGVADGAAIGEVDGDPTTNMTPQASAPPEQFDADKYKPALDTNDPVNSTRSPADTAALIAIGTQLGKVLPNKIDGNWKGT